MRPATATSFDVAIWFLDRARIEDTYLQPRKLQCLLFLAQAHYAGAFNGRVLMPSFFVFDEGGPIDPNLFRALENGRPDITEGDLDDEILIFLEAIWRRYNESDALGLDRLISQQGAAEPAIRSRDKSEVGLAAMQRMFARRGNERAGINGPVIAKTATGREVTVTKWTPKRKIIAR